VTFNGHVKPSGYT